jgi:hypothetical protein
MGDHVSNGVNVGCYQPDDDQGGRQDHGEQEDDSSGAGPVGQDPASETEPRVGAAVRRSVLLGHGKTVKGGRGPWCALTVRCSRRQPDRLRDVQEAVDGRRRRVYHGARRRTRLSGRCAPEVVGMANSRPSLRTTAGRMGLTSATRVAQLEGADCKPAGVASMSVIGERLVELLCTR